MEIIFYIFAIIPIFWELIVIKDTKTTFEFYKKYDEKLNNNEELTKEESFFSNIMILYGIFNIIGLFTSQYLLFLALLLLGFIPKHRSENWLRFDGVLSLIVLIFIVFNKYHFHIDFGYDAIISLFHEKV